MATTMQRPVAERNMAMYPFVFVTSEPSMLAIAGWGLPWLLLGYAIRSSAGERRPAPHGGLANYLSDGNTHEDN